MSLTHIDCFSGPGGICTGLKAAGFDTKVAIEYIKSCVDTYSANHKHVHIIHSDIRQVSEEQILPFVPEEGVDLVTSGMPCETFSTAGNTSGRTLILKSLKNNDSRRNTSYSLADIRLSGAVFISLAIIKRP